MTALVTRSNAATAIRVRRAPAHAQPFDVVAQERQHRGQEGRAATTAEEHDRDGAQAQRNEDRGRHEQERRERQHDDEAGEEDRSTGGAPSAFKGVDLVPAAQLLLAIARDDEEGVVDADGQADHGDHVGHEERQLHDLADDGGQAEGDEDGHDPEDDNTTAATTLPKTAMRISSAMPIPMDSPRCSPSSARRLKSSSSCPGRRSGP